MKRIANIRLTAGKIVVNYRIPGVSEILKHLEGIKEF